MVSCCHLKFYDQTTGKSVKVNFNPFWKKEKECFFSSISTGIQDIMLDSHSDIKNSYSILNIARLVCCCHKLLSSQYFCFVLHCWNRTVVKREREYFPFELYCTSLFEAKYSWQNIECRLIPVMDVMLTQQNTLYITRATSADPDLPAHSCSLFGSTLSASWPEIM
jgi:hypothetical protein